MPGPGVVKGGSCCTMGGEVEFIHSTGDAEVEGRNKSSGEISTEV